MTKEEFYTMASPQKFQNIAKLLNEEERDILKFKISRLCVSELENDFELPKDFNQKAYLNIALKCLSEIHPYKERVPPYGIVYKGRPSFMTDQLLFSLQAEAIKCREKAVINIEQYITCAETKEKNSIAEQFEDLSELHNLVNQYAGNSKPSFISNYIYYDVEGQCSKPHIDNSFTAITVMVGLKHDYPDNRKTSSSIAYWSEMPRSEYKLFPGEISIFYGASAIHGRTPVSNGEIVHSLLLSYRPII